LLFDLWFPTNSEEIENVVKKNFTKDLEMAISGKLIQQEWNTPLGVLAKVILLDKFSRIIYKNTPKAFSQDPLALNFSYKAIKEGIDLQVTPIQSCFLYSPFLNSELFILQEMGSELFKKLMARVKESTEEHKIVMAFNNYAEKQLETLQLWGRFPQSNEALRRPNTKREEEYSLIKKKGSSSFVAAYNDQP